MGKEVVSEKILADYLTPAAAFSLLDNNGYSFLLESAERGKTGRYSFIGFSPRRVYVLHENKVDILGRNSRGEYSKHKSVKTDDPVGYLEKIQEKYKISSPEELPPFCGGLVGYASYEIIKTWENIHFDVSADPDLPLGVFMFVDETVAFDHLYNTAHIIKLDIKSDRSAALKRVREIKSILTSPQIKQEQLGDVSCGVEKYSSNFTKEEYMAAVKRIKEKIFSGEIIQGVLSQRLHAKRKGDSFNYYRRLRALNPSPYMFFMRLGELILCGSSPEVMVKKTGSRAVLRPIAGTRPRHKNAQKEKRIEEELKSDSKERAEHVMLVDLGRNDLSRVCRSGSVKYSGLMTVEKYSHVMHLVTSVSGELKPRVGCSELFKACFPAGTVSGAPKIRAIKIIAQEEKMARGPYAGAVGYMSFSGDMDMCIAIRTMLIHGDRVYVQAGAGIVADSVPEKEYQETLSKAEALCRG